MSSVAPVADTVSPRPSTGLVAMFEHTRYVLGENQGHRFCLRVAGGDPDRCDLRRRSWCRYDPLATDTASALSRRPRRIGSAPINWGAIFSAALSSPRSSPPSSRSLLALVFLLGGLAGSPPAISAAGPTASSAALPTPSWRFRCSCWRWGSPWRRSAISRVQIFAIATAIVNFPLYAPVARSEANVRATPAFVQAARSVGQWRVSDPAGPHPAQHPCRSMIVVQMSLDHGLTPSSMPQVSPLIGLGVRPPTAEWGIMVAEGAGFMVSGRMVDRTVPGVWR